MTYYQLTPNQERQLLLAIGDTGSQSVLRSLKRELAESLVEHDAAISNARDNCAHLVAANKLGMMRVQGRTVGKTFGGPIWHDGVAAIVKACESASGLLCLELLVDLPDDVNGDARDAVRIAIAADAKHMTAEFVTERAMAVWRPEMATLLRSAREWLDRLKRL